MARKAGSSTPGGRAKTAAPKRPADNPLEILHPNATVRIRGRVLQVREYGYIEGLQLQAGIGGLLDALHALFSTAGTPPSAPQVRQVLAAHATTLQWLMAQAVTPINEDPAELEVFAQAVAANASWVATLDDVQGDALMAVWWGVNAGFFTRRLRERLLADRAGSPSAPGASTPT